MPAGDKVHRDEQGRPGHAQVEVARHGEVVGELRILEMPHARRADARIGQTVVKPGGRAVAQIGPHRLVDRREDLHQNENDADKRQPAGKGIAMLHGRQPARPWRRRRPPAALPAARGRPTRRPPVADPPSAARRKTSTLPARRRFSTGSNLCYTRRPSLNAIGLLGRPPEAAADEEIVQKPAQNPAGKRPDDRHPPPMVARDKDRLSPSGDRRKEPRPEVAGRVDGVARVVAERHSDQARRGPRRREGPDSSERRCSWRR